MIKVGTNYLGVFFRIGFFIFWAIFTGFIIKRNFIDVHHSEKETIACLVYLIFVSLVWVFFFVSFRGVFKVAVNEEKLEIALSFLFSKKIIKVNDIQGYYVNRFWTRIGRTEGIILKMKSGGLIHLNEFELDSLFELNQYLISKDIPCIGKTFSMLYPFRTIPK